MESGTWRFDTFPGLLMMFSGPGKGLGLWGALQYTLSISFRAMFLLETLEKIHFHAFSSCVLWLLAPCSIFTVNSLAFPHLSLCLNDDSLLEKEISCYTKACKI